MSDDSNNDTSAAAQQPAVPDGTALSLASTEDGGKFNTIRIPLRPVDCWPLDAPGFAFDSSVVAPKFKTEVADLSKIVARNPGCPAALFGHCDPAGSDELNKTLGDRRVIAIYALLTRQPALWAYIYDNPAVGDTWGTKAIQSMLSNLVPPQPSDDDQPSSDDQPRHYYEGEDDGKYGSGTTAAVRNFQHDQKIPETGKADADTRTAIFTAYMNWLCTPQSPPGDSPTSTPPASTTTLKMAPTDFLGGAGAEDGDLPKMSLQGCSEFNPIVLLPASEMKASGNTTQRNADDAPNRRVIMYFFKKGTTVDPAAWPCPKVKEPLAACKKAFWPDGDARRTSGDELREYKNAHDTMACRFYDRIARRSKCESVVRPNIIKFFGRPAVHDDVAVEAHRILVPEGTDVTLHWETRRADSVAITGFTLDGSATEVPLPNGGAQVNDGKLQVGQAGLSASSTVLLSLTASNAACTRRQYRRVDIVTYPPPEEATGLLLGEDTIDVVRKPSLDQLVESARAQELGEMVAGAGGGTVERDQSAAKDPKNPIPVYEGHAPTLLKFAVSKYKGSPQDVLTFRYKAAQMLLSLSNVGLVNNEPAGRRDAYLDIVSWDDNGRDNMQKMSGGSSSCMMFVRMFWWLLGFRGGAMEKPWNSKTLLSELYDISRDADKKKRLAPAYGKPAAGLLTARAFRPLPGDVLYLYDNDNNQHMFPIVATMGMPAKDQPLTLFTIYSVDGGQSDGKGDVGTCHAVHRVTHNMQTVNPPFTMKIGTHPKLPIGVWFDLGKLLEAYADSMAPMAEVTRDAANLPLDPAPFTIEE